jgi:hypothetical protein
MPGNHTNIHARYTERDLFVDGVRIAAALAIIAIGVLAVLGKI